MKKLKSVLALLLALVMVLSLAACGGNSAEDTKAPAADDTKAPAADDDTTAAPADDTTASGLDWLNLGGVYPIVDEGVEKTLSICLPIDDEVIDLYEDGWQYIVTTELLNINLDVQAVPSSAWGEKLPLILADVENLPDIIMNAGFSTAQLLRYGAEEGLLLDLAPYITEEYMPLLSAFFEKYPQYKSVWTDADGHIYSINKISNTDTIYASNRFFLNYKWMQDCGLDPMTDLPETLDEFTDLMRKFKEVKSAELGEEIYPISGGFTGGNGVHGYLLAACGFAGAFASSNDFPGGAISMRNGKVTLPAADREGWEGFVTTLKQWYDEGLVHSEFITGEASALDALISAGKTGFLSAMPPQIYVGLDNATNEWWGATMLSSEWCDEPATISDAGANGVGQHVITTACKEIELALAFFDFFYEQTNDPSTQNYYWMSHGAYEGTPEAELYPDFVLARNFGKYSYEHIVSEEYVDANDMLKKKLGLWGNACVGLNFIEDEITGPVLAEADDVLEMMVKYEGKGVESYTENYPRDKVYFLSPVMRWAFARQYQLAPNEEFPAVVHLDAATAERANELLVAIKEFAVTETAKFIVGDRPLEELPDYFDEIEALGATEYVKIYADYFAAVNG